VLWAILTIELYKTYLTFTADYILLIRCFDLNNDIVTVREHCYTNMFVYRFTNPNVKWSANEY